ncbi:uncharacterized protein LOC103953962 [Pyrus x bretschneideri]|uniref:uncharacterized protein LOC103953962 n=1 Tax=Pyrus x bretschneideri TaxID=225117 RepID=UPI0020308D3B|nr:uncharacterized protein LOC103953962 [Pyrus x bretschneideri]
MSCLRSNTWTISVLFLSIFLFVPLISGTPDLFDIIRATAVQVGREEGHVGFHGMVGWDTAARRFLEEKGGENRTVMLLAEQRTRRRDPLDKFKKYSGGWDLKNKHYWASVGFTAAPFFVTAVVWFVVFGISLLLICFCYCCCRKEQYGYSRVAYALSLTILIFFTLMAIIGCVLLYTGQDRFHSSTCNTLGYVVAQADRTAENLRNVSEYLSASKTIGINAIVLPADIQQSIDGVMGSIKNAATILSDTTEKSSKRIQDGLDIMRLALIVLAAVMLCLVFVGFLVSIFGMECLVYFLVILGWILVTGTFILCGVFLLVHNVFADACVSMDEWVQKQPTAHTALDEILPCVNKDTAKMALARTRDASYYAVVVLNRVVTDVANSNSQANGPFYFNQTGLPLPLLCNPFDENRNERKCVDGEIQMQDVQEVWKKYVCQSSPANVCITPGRLTPNYYNQLSAFVNVIYALYRYSPFFVELIDCTFVRDAFSDISRDHCPGLRIHSAWMYIGLFLVSAAVMFSLIFWVIYARERRHRVYTKKVLSSRVWLEQPAELALSQTHSRSSSRRTPKHSGLQDRAA